MTVSFQLVELSVNCMAAQYNRDSGHAELRAASHNLLNPCHLRQAENGYGMIKVEAINVIPREAKVPVRLNAAGATCVR